MLVNMGRVFQQTALQFADHPAVINVERDRRFTYARMHDLTNKLSNALKHRFGLGQGDFYATILANDNMALFHPWMLKSPVGAVWIDVRDSVDEQISRINHVKPKLIFLEAKVLPRLYEPLRDKELTFVVMDPPENFRPGVYYFWDIAEQSAAAEVEEEFRADKASEHISVLRFTGGTTGTAKCAQYTLANLWTWGCNPAHFYETFPFDHPRAMFFSPLHHAASGSVVIPVHIKGGTVITLNGADPEAIGQSIESHKVDMIYAVPTVLYRMLRNEPAPQVRSQQSENDPLRRVTDFPGQIGNTDKNFSGRYSSRDMDPPNAGPLSPFWGATTTAPKPKSKSTDCCRWGGPCRARTVMVCDKDGKLLPAGQRGEIWIRGPNTIQGYYQAAELTQKNFSSSGFWKSGDMGYMDEAGLRLPGRPQAGYDHHGRLQCLRH